MQVVKQKVFVQEDDDIICPKCSTNNTYLRDDSDRTYNNWNNDDGFVTCDAEEYIICHHCKEKIVLKIWTEEF